MTSLVLGTAQLGAGYGITNSARRIDDETVRAILEEAALAGIDIFDTAADYDDSQDRLGQLAPAGTSPTYVTKFALVPGEDYADGDVLYRRSMARLHADQLYGLLFHRVSDLASDQLPVVLDRMREARAAGTIQKIGVSIYDREDLELVLERFSDLDILQIPGSVVDRRLLDDPDVGALQQRGVEIHVRSAFLQGLLLSHPDQLPDRFAELAPVLAQLDETARAQHTSVLAVLLGFLKHHPRADRVIVGSTSATELRAITEAWISAQPAAAFASDLPVEIVDPRRWS